MKRLGRGLNSQRLDHLPRSGLLDATVPGDSLSSDRVTAIAQKLGKDWEKLAPLLGLDSKDVGEIREDSEDVILRVSATSGQVVGIVIIVGTGLD